MTRTLYAAVITVLAGAYLAALMSIGPDHGPRYVPPPAPHTLVTVAPGWVSVNGESPVPECAEGDDCNGPDYR